MKTWAVIPVKSLPQTKSRLTAVLSAAERADLTQQLLRRLLQLLSQSAAVQQIVVVSQDDTVQRLARPYGAITLAEPAGAGLNVAVQLGMDLAAVAGVARVLILPSDLPFLTAADMKPVMETAVAKPQPSVICPDRHHQGTNALLIPPQVGFQFQFGPGSFHKHRREMARLGLQPRIIRTPGWQFDLDTVEDWAFYTAGIQNP